MHSFKVVRESCGWSVRLGDGMTTPFWGRDLAIREANSLCDALRSHGQAAEVVIEGKNPADAAGVPDGFAISGMAPRLKNEHPARR
jgi:hypothetical protein